MAFDTVLIIGLISALCILSKEKQKVDLIATAHMRDLQDSLTFQNLIMNNIPDILFVKDDKFRIVSCNPSFKSLYPKQDQDMIIGYTTVEQYNTAQAQEFLKHDREAFEKGISEVEEKITFPDGNQRTLLTKKVRFKNEDNQSYILGIASDITDRKNAENEILRSNEELERFAYIASHDLQEPLRMISNFTKLLREEHGDKMNEEACNYMKFMLDAAERMQHLINDLLDYSKIGSGESKSVRFSSRHKIQSAIHNLQESINESKGSIKLIGEFPTLYINPIRFTRLVQNLIGNALKYSHEQRDPIIEIKVKNEKDHYLFSILDNGIGIKEEYLQQIFILFKRLHNKDEYSGTGIGLAICSKIVEGFKKANFGLNPITTNLQRSISPSQKMKETIMNPIEILLVEDNEGDIFLTKKAFKAARITNNIEVVMDGEEALRFLKAEDEYAGRSKPDIVFLDINLPKKDGKQVLHEVKSDPNIRNIPIVVLTSSNAEKDILGSYDLQANAYITKPINIEKFYDIVQATEDFWFNVVTLPDRNPND